MKSSFKTPILSLACATLFVYPLSTLLAQDGEATDVRVTHGPLLGRPGPDTMSLWVRTEKPGEVKVFYGTEKGHLDHQASLVTTDLAKDRTGIITLDKLNSNTRYYYRIADHQLEGSFRTLPKAADFRNPEGNPKGLFNFKFEFNSFHGHAHGFYSTCSTSSRSRSYPE